MNHAGRCVSSSMRMVSAVLAGLLFTACRATEAKFPVAEPGPTRTESPPSKAAYPEVLRETWLPKRMGCVPADAQGHYQGEDLLYIGADMLGQYENTSKPLQVEQVAVRPPAWTIATAFSPGTGEYEGAEIVAFVLRGEELSVKTGEATAVYVKCRYKVD